MSLSDIAGVVGAFLMLGAFGAASLGKLDPARAPALLMNLTGALLVLYSLSHDFNLSAVILETAWALVAVVGLVRLATRKRT